MRCLECKKQFEPKPGPMAKKQKFCSPKCRWVNWDKKHPRVYEKPKETP